MRIVLTNFFFLLIVSSIMTITLPISADEESSPFQEVINKLNAIENNLTSIDKRLTHELSKLASKDESGIGTENMFDAMAEKICLLNGQLDDILSYSPDDEDFFSEIKQEVVDIELKATIIVNRVDKLFLNTDYIEIALERVTSNSQITVYIAKEYYSPPGSGCGAVSDNAAHIHSLISIGDINIEVDEDGFICDPEKWNEDVAAALAEIEAIDELVFDHWDVIYYLRNYYLQYDAFPMIRKLCQDTGFKLNELYELFPAGPAKGACKIAGLPKPTGCV